jgi:hypothetical protein
MLKKDRARIDYMPGGAAVDALGIAAAMFPDMRQQALIDKLVITGLCALHWKPPMLYGADRDRWQLPEQFRTVSESADD